MSEPFFEQSWQKLLTQNLGAKAKVICDELLDHKFEFAKVDATLTDVAYGLDYAFWQISREFSIEDHIQNQPGLNATIASPDDLAAMKHLLAMSFNDSRRTLAEGLARLSREQDIFWDDSERSIYGMNELTQHTVFGKALHDYYCFVSQQDDAGLCYI